MNKLLITISLSIIPLLLKAQVLKGIVYNATNQTKLFFEKAYLHTDRDVYLQGDTLCYKAYLTDAQTNILSPYSRNLYVELINADSTEVSASQMIRMTDGCGNGDFTIFDSLPAGHYRLRAYTRWMMNFNDAFVFSKDITVLSRTGADIKKEKTKVKADTVSIAATEEGEQESGQIRFYPEGGYLVEGLGSLVAVKAENAQGLGISTKGAIFNTRRDTVAWFATDSLGFGLLMLKPQKGQHYYASVQGNPAHIVPLPDALSQGFSLRISNRDSLIQANVSFSNGTKPDTTAKEFSLVATHAGQVFHQKSFRFSGKESTISIPVSNFPRGVTAFILYDQDNRPVCERLTFIHYSQTEPVLRLSANKTTYHPYETATVHIKAPSKASLSVAVVDASSVPIQRGNIRSYLLLESEIKGTIERPERYFDPQNANRFNQLEILLMTQGWRQFIWRRLADSVIRLKYPREEGVRIAGRVTDRNKRKGLAGLNVSLYALGATGTKLFSTHADSAGRFVFTEPELYGEQRVKLSAMNSKGEKQGVIILDSLPSLPLIPLKQKALREDNHEQSVEMIAAAGSLNKGIRLREVNITARKNVVTRNGTFMSWGPEQSFTITQKDLAFKTLRWWMLQNVKGAIADNENGIAFVGLDTARQVGGQNYREKSVKMAPQLYINGRDYFTPDREERESLLNNFLSMPIDKFKRVVLRPVAGVLINVDLKAATVVVDRYLLYLTLKEGVLNGLYSFEPGSLHPLISGYYQTRNFYVPPAGSPAIDKAGYRPTIYWNPIVSTNEKGEAVINYPNNGSLTPVRVIVQGLTGNGEPISSVIGYNVEE